MHLKITRKKHGFTQEKLAYESDITLSQIARIETGKRNTSVITIIRLAQAMKIHPRELLNFEIE